MSRYYIADLHFYHAILNTKMDARGFSSEEEMNRYMIQKWNERVSEKDEVVIIGDFSFGNAQQTQEVLNQLNGKLYLVIGNHDHVFDKASFDKSRFVWIKHYAEIKDNKRKVVLCHYPIMFYNGQYHGGNPKSPSQGTYMLHGHIHGTRDDELLKQFIRQTRQTYFINMQGNEQTIPCNLVNCFCKFSDYVPLTLDEWIEIQERRLLE